MNIFTKAYNVFKNYLEEWKLNQENNKRAKETKYLRRLRKSDIERWKKNQELHKNWNERTAIIAEMIPHKANIIEFGAGNMELKKLMPANCKYTPSDICERSPGMLICDLNKGIEFTLEPYDTAVFSGVLEYVYDVKDVFITLRMNNLKHVVLSYACSDVSKAPRLERGWLSDFSRKELETIFYENKFEVIEYKEWRKQSIYHLIMK